MQKVLFFLNSDVRGGVEEHVLSIMRGLDRTRFAPSLAAPATLLKVMKEDLQELKVPVHEICIQKWTDFEGKKKWQELLLKEKPDIVHTHLFKAALHAAPIAKKCGVPRIIDTAHIREEWRKGIKKMFFIDRWVYGHVDHIISVSHAIKRYLVNDKKIPAKKISVGHNGVHLERFHTQGSRPNERITVGVIGRLELQKGHCYFLEAVKLLEDLRKNICFKIIGEGSLESVLTAQAKELGLQGQIQFTGFRSDIREAYEECDIIVLPSLFEGLPLVALEASAMQKALIVTNVDGSPEAVVHQETGLVVEPRDPKGLMEAMKILIENKDIRETYAKNARRHVEENFNVDKQVRETMDVYAVKMREEKDL